MRTDDATPATSSTLADRLLRRADPATAGLWPRASALLALQALEASAARGSGSGAPSTSRAARCATQLICLRSYLEDAPLAARAGHAWSALSRACHHHPYELGADGRGARSRGSRSWASSRTRSSKRRPQPPRKTGPA